MLGTTKEIATLVKQAKLQGWSITKTNGGHLRWTSPSGSFFFSALTPSDRRTIQNLKRDLRVNGFIILERKKGRR